MSEPVTEAAYYDALKWAQRVRLHVAQAIADRHARATTVGAIIRRSNDVAVAFCGEQKQELIEAMDALAESDSSLRKLVSLGERYAAIVETYESEQKRIARALAAATAKARRERQAKQALARKTLSVKPRRVRSEPDEVRLPAPLVSIDRVATYASHLLADEVERAARAHMRWAPWARRSHQSRRYEGYSR